MSLTQYFASQCTPLENGSIIPNNQVYTTGTKIRSIKFNEDNIIKAIRDLGINKPYEHDDVTIRMIKVCDYAIMKPLSMIFKNCISFGELPDKKNDKQTINNYRPVLLLPICRKLFERLIFNSFFNCLKENKLLSAH